MQQGSCFHLPHHHQNLFDLFELRQAVLFLERVEKAGAHIGETEQTIVKVVEEKEVVEEKKVVEEKQLCVVQQILVH